jgi:hypothetical protein
MRDLVRARADMADALCKARQRLMGFLLRHGRSYDAKRWTWPHRKWLMEQEHGAGGQGAAAVRGAVSVGQRRAYPRHRAAGGTIFTLDLRLLGFFGNAPLEALAPPLVRVAASGVVLAAVSGFLLFSVQPRLNVSNPAFLIKLTLLVLGLLNILALRLGVGWRQAVEGGFVR